MVLTPEQEQFWQAYLTEHPDAGAHTRHVVAGRPGSPGIADQLIELYLSGVKTAGSGLVEDYLLRPEKVRACRTLNRLVTRENGLKPLG